jgi:hypothetical protein
MKELGRALHPKLQSLDDYNKHCHDVAKGLSYLSRLPPIDMRELFAIAQVSALAGYDDAYLDKAYLDIINEVNDGTTLTHDLVKTKLRGQLKLRDRALARDGTRSSAVALKTSLSFGDEIVVRVSYMPICLEGRMFGGPLFIFSDLPPFLATMTSFPRIHMYTLSL